MTRYIDADKFLKSMITKFKCVPLLGVSKYINGEECFEGEHLNSLINEIPTADVVSKSEVAEEIIGEVRQALLNMVLANAIGETYDLEKFFAELKKKYT